MNMVWRMKKIIITALALYLASAPAGRVIAEESHSTPITVTHAWSPPTLGKQKIGVVYFTIRNDGETTDFLTGIDLPDGGKAHPHASELKDGIMRMRPSGPIQIPPGGVLEMRPGGEHVMLTDLPGPLIRGGTIKLILHFRQAGDIQITAQIAASVTPTP